MSLKSTHWCRTSLAGKFCALLPVLWALALAPLDCLQAAHTKKRPILFTGFELPRSTLGRISTVACRINTGNYKSERITAQSGMISVGLQSISYFWKGHSSKRSLLPTPSFLLLITLIPLASKVFITTQVGSGSLFNKSNIDNQENNREQSFSWMCCQRQPPKLLRLTTHAADGAVGRQRLGMRCRSPDVTSLIPSSHLLRLVLAAFCKLRKQRLKRLRDLLKILPSGGAGWEQVCLTPGPEM